MQRLTISLDDDLAQRFETWADEHGYANRSEAIRDLLRKEFDTRAVETGRVGRCVAALSYVYDHHERHLGERLIERHHAHHDLIVATTHVHIDHSNCLETALLRGPLKQVERLAASVIAETGVRHGQLNLVPVKGGNGHAHHHSHDTPHS